MFCLFHTRTDPWGLTYDVDVPYCRYRNCNLLVTVTLTFDVEAVKERQKCILFDPSVKLQYKEVARNLVVKVRKKEKLTSLQDA